MQSSISDFMCWLENGRKLRENTIRMYVRYLKELQEIHLIEMSEEEICGILNSTLVKFPNNIAKSAFINYIEFLFTSVSGSDPIFFEQMRVKKNNIISNTELPKGSREEYDLDLEKHYIDKEKFMRVWNQIDLKTKYVVLLLYDGALRINELLKNDWKNIDETEIRIPRRLAKSHRERTVNWLVPESKKIISVLKKPEQSGTFQKTLGVSYYSIWYSLCPKKSYDNSFNPHALRHTRLTDLAGDGWELGALQERAGHSDPKITQRYISWTKNRKAIPIEKWCVVTGVKLL